MSSIAAVAVALLAAGESAPAAASAAGERLYRHGLLASGRPAEAVVEADVTITGEQVSCASCHGRSGMGSIEGRRLAPPVTPEFLSGPRKLRSRPRPAYTDETLARAIRDGIDAGGNQLDRLMPRYRLGDRDMAALIGHLRTLSRDPSPGASADRLELATVIAPGMPLAAEQTMMAVLQGYANAKNAGARDLRARHIASWPEYFGEWNLQVWRLSGPSSGWRAQLEKHYRSRPVFALLSGLGGDEWSAVHRFCDDRHIPCLLPNLDSPPEPGEDAYSLYFDSGVLVEARGIAAKLEQLPAPQRVLQIYRPVGGGGRAAATLAAALRGASVVDFPLRGALVAADVARRAREVSATAVVLWLAAADLQGFAPDTFAGARVFVSSTSAGGQLSSAPAFADGFAAQPGALPADAERRFGRVAGWMKARGLAPAKGLSERRIADQTFFAATTLSEGIMHVHKYLYRDYLLEAIDHLTGLETFSAYFPRLSFGPGQRVLSKGCWIVPLGGGGAPEWLVP